MDDRFPVVFELPDRKPEEGVLGERLSVGLWHPGDEGFTVLWNAGKVEVEGKHVYEAPSYALVKDTSLFLGLNTGCVHKVDISGSRILGSFDRLAVPADYREWDKFGNKPAYEKHNEFCNILKKRAESSPDLAEKLRELESEERRLNMFGIHFIMTGYHKIRSLVEHEGVVYDAGSTGFFKTETGEQLCDAHMHSAVVVDGMLCYVPDFQCFLKMIETGRRERIVNSRSLVNASNSSVLMKGIVPPEGSSQKGHQYCISGDRVYVYDDTYPCEKITIRNFPENKRRNITTEMTVNGSGGFVAWNSQVYDLREVIDRQRKVDRQTLMRSDSLDDAVVEFDPEREYVTSMVSGGDRAGILMTVHDNQAGKTRIFSHLEPQKPLFETETSFTFL